MRRNGLTWGDGFGWGRDRHLELGFVAGIL